DFGESLSAAAVLPFTMQSGIPGYGVSSYGGVEAEYQKAVEMGWKHNPSNAALLALACLDELKDLGDGWDSYSPPAPSSVAIANARALVQEAGGLNTAPERVEPSAMGGVGVTFASGLREVVIEFYNKGTAHALFSDDATGDMRTQPVPTDASGYR